MENKIFNNRQEFRNWLKENAEISSGEWLVFNKDTLKASEALEEALCFGWIDGLIKKLDDNNYKKRFTPRQKHSKWSEKNKQLVEQLEKEGLLTIHGKEVVDNAKANGMWDIVHKTEVNDKQIEEFISLIKDYKPAYNNFLNMSNSVKKTYVKHYNAAKAIETKTKRLNQIIDRLNENKKPM